MEGELRKSHIKWRVGQVADDNCKFLMKARMNFGRKEVKEILEKMKANGIPEDKKFNIMIVNDCEDEAAATAIAAKVEEMKSHPIVEEGPRLLTEMATKLTTVSHKDGQFFAAFDIEEGSMKPDLAKWNDVLGNFGECSQFIEASIQAPKPIKGILGEGIDLKNINGSQIALQAGLAKGLPMKIADMVIAESGAYGPKPEEIKLIARICSMFHHLTLDLEIANADDITKGVGEDAIPPPEITTGMLQKAGEFLNELGVLDVAKTAGTVTKAYMTLFPFLSFEITIQMPTLTDLFQ